MNFESLLNRLISDCVMCEVGSRMLLVSLNDPLGEEAVFPKSLELLEFLGPLLAKGEIAVAKMQFPETSVTDYIFHKRNLLAVACAQSCAENKH